MKVCAALAGLPDALQANLAEGVHVSVKLAPLVWLQQFATFWCLWSTWKNKVHGTASVGKTGQSGGV